MRQAYLKLTAYSSSNDTTEALVRHDHIAVMHVEDGKTVIMHPTNGGLKVKESIEDILRMMESPVITIKGDEVEVIPYKH